MITDKQTATDRDTVDYFNDQVTEYSPGRFAFATEFINNRVTPDSSFIDVGCGVGNIIELVQKNTPIRHVAGIDAAGKCVEKTKERLGCEAYHGSLLDGEFIDSIPQKFDFVLVASVLHHLVGKTRHESKRYAVVGIHNALRLLTPGGHLIVFEPVIYPATAASMLFHTKRFVSGISSSRVQLFDKWNNIGAPVVSYYTTEQLYEMMMTSAGCRVVARNTVDHHVNFLWKLGGIRRRVDTTLVAQKLHE